MPMPLLAVKSFDSSTSALAGSHAAQHRVMVLPCACAGVADAAMPSAAAIPHAADMNLAVYFMCAFPPNRAGHRHGAAFLPARMLIEPSDTVLDELRLEATFPRARTDSCRPGRTRFV